MNYGLELSAAGLAGDPRSLAALAAVAEASGWHGCFLEDYIVHWQLGIPTFDPWIGLAAMALSTTTLRLGTTVTPLARRRPWKVAREVTTLDHLSNGRMILGVGIGDEFGHDFEDFAEELDLRERAAQLDEGLAILAGTWSGLPFGFHGAHYQIEHQTFLPEPVQQPRVPIWVGGSAQRIGPIRRAAQWDGMLPLPKHDHTDRVEHLRPEDIRALRETIMVQRVDDAHFDIAVGGRARNHDHEWEQAHIRSIADAGATWWMEWVPAADFSTMRNAIARGPLR
jgi:alkanesulfonate monooxygenase SsuD/methylene tetrahydromethanopterin reductase-like flavin-dependent oxidoreductase (luciferase family)